MELPAMAEGLLEEEEEFERSWEPPVRNLDKFFTSMYHYHNTKGLPTILITQLCSVISLGFTTSFSIFLLGFIDWSALKNCHDEASCGGASHYIASNPFQQFSFARNLFILIYSFILIAFWLWRSYHSFNIVKRAVQMEKFYREKLGIKVSDLPSLQWDDIVQRLIKLHDHGVHRVAVKEKLTEHDVVLRIMRKDNYMIGLINKNILDLRVPWWIAPFISERLFLTKSLEWSLSFCIMEYIFNDQFAISTLFLKDINGLRGRFVMVGLIHLALLPFMIIFMSISFFLQNAQSFHSNKAYLGPRQWSPLALWTFREFNELPHIFDERINKSISPANEYISLFHNVNAVIVARSAAYITGSFVATLLVLSFLAEGVFLYVNVADHNMLWWLGVFSAMYAGARSVIPDETKIASDPEELMQKISSYTHYFPLHWTNNCHTYAVRNDLAELFPYKAKVFAMEVLSVVMTPLVLCFSLPHCAPTIIEFVRDHSRYVEGVGAVCDYSLFDFEQYGDEQYGAPASGYMGPNKRPEGGKLEQSYLNFQRAHPRWEGTGAAGRAFIEKLSTYRAVRAAEHDVQVSDALRNSFYPQNTYAALSDQGIMNPLHKQQTDSGTQDQDEHSRGPDALSQQSVHQGLERTSVGLMNGVWTPQGYTPQSHTQTLNQRRAGGGSDSRQYEDSISSYNKTIQKQPNTLYSNNPVTPNPTNEESSYLGNHHQSQQQLNQQRGESRSQPPITHVPSLLRSILNQENIDYENDFYWLNRFHVEKNRDPIGLEQSLLHSQYNPGIGNTSGGLHIDNNASLNLLKSRFPSNIWNHHNIYHSRKLNPNHSNAFIGDSAHDFNLDLSLAALGDQIMDPNNPMFSQISLMQMQSQNTVNSPNSRKQSTSATLHPYPQYTVNNNRTTHGIKNLHGHSKLVKTPSPGIPTLRSVSEPIANHADIDHSLPLRDMRDTSIELTSVTTPGDQSPPILKYEGKLFDNETESL